MLFLVICAAAYRLRASTHSNLVLILLAATVTAIVLVAFSVDTLRNAPATFVAMILIGGARDRVRRSLADATACRATGPIRLVAGLRGYA